MLALGIHVGLGPDGPAGSNNDFDMMEEMNLAADLAKVSTGDPRSVSAEQALEMATINGARVIGRERDLGSLEAGKLADMVAVRLDRPHAVPLYNIYSQLVYALKASDVRDVMVNGRVIVSDAAPSLCSRQQSCKKHRNTAAVSPTPCIPPKIYPIKYQLVA